MKKFLPFKEAREMVLKESPKHGINTERKWQYQNKYGYERPHMVPYSPNIAYKNKGWVSWSHWLGTNNIRGTLRRYIVNDHFFKKWSGDMAYVFGFWAADGYIRKRWDRYSYEYGFGICQQSKDRYILEKILEAMGSNNHICCPKTRPNMSHFEINSQKIFNDVVKLGGLPRKSLVMRFPDIPKKYLPDFLRGYFDGDGCISLNTKNHSVHCYFCSGSEKFIGKLQTILYDTWGIKGKPCYSSCFRLTFGMQDVLKLGNIMYGLGKSKIRLERKYDKFNGLMKYRRQKYGSKK